MKPTPFLNMVLCVSFILVCFTTVNPSHAEDFRTSTSFSANNTSTAALWDSSNLTLSDNFWGLNWHKEWHTGSETLAAGNPDRNDSVRFPGKIKGNTAIGRYPQTTCLIIANPCTRVVSNIISICKVIINTLLY